MPNPLRIGFTNLCTTAPVIHYPCLTTPFYATFLQAWALFKGKFREGIDKLDPPTWKTRLRCALNKSNDFEELVQRSQLDISDPYKVYRIIPECAKKRQFNIFCIYFKYSGLGFMLQFYVAVYNEFK